MAKLVVMICDAGHQSTMVMKGDHFDDDYLDRFCEVMSAGSDIEGGCQWKSSDDEGICGAGVVVEHEDIDDEEQKGDKTVPTVIPGEDEESG